MEGSFWRLTGPITFQSLPQTAMVLAMVSSNNKQRDITNMQIVRVKDPHGKIHVGIVRTEQGGFVQLPAVEEIQELLRLPLAELRTSLEQITDVEGKNTTTLLAPIDG